MTDEQVRQFRTEYQQVPYGAKMEWAARQARRLGIHVNTIWTAAKGRSYRWVEG